ncbi:MAG: competence/damage-inducible protein A [Phycisphaerae bacterium]|nr:competence/damage-inducible protein A [Phycisphaerae bacterium]
MIARILSIGTELTLGQTVDTNSAWLAQQLAELGIETVAHATVPDELEPIQAEIERAARDADVLMVTGGLGPTQDDLTREALARVMNVPLDFHAPTLERIREFFRSRNLQMPEADRREAMVPRGATLLDNDCGTAPGLRARIGRCDAFVLPGVPREMRSMFDRTVRPVLAGRGGFILQRVLRTFGLPEARIGELIADLMQRGRNPTIGTTAQAAVVGIRINARARTLDEAAALLDRDAAEIRRRLGDYVFGEGDATLQQAVAELLWRHGRTVATAESCTGGLLAKALTDVPGSSRYFLCGWVTYSNAAKQRELRIDAARIERHGAVCREVAESMALGARTLSGADYAIGITGIAGPEGGSPEKPVGLVYVSLASPDGCEVRELRLGEYLSRGEIRDRAAKAALNMLRLALLTSASQPKAAPEIRA